MDSIQTQKLEEDKEDYYEYLKNASSNSVLEINRMPTQLDDEEQAYDMYSIEQVFKRFSNYGITLMISGVLLQFYFYNLISAVFSIIPLIVLEILLIFEFISKFRDEYHIIQSVLKNEYFIDLITSIGNILSYILLTLYIENKLNYLTISSLPLVLTFIFKIFTKAHLANKCISFSNIVIPKQIRLISKFINILVFILIGLKIDNILYYNWNNILVPFFIGILLCFLVGLASIILLTIQHFSKNPDKNSYFANLWLAYTFLGCSTSFLSIYLLSKSQFFLVIPISYIFGFVLLTQIFQKKLTSWWFDFFINNSEDYPILTNYNNPLPIPKSQQISINQTFTEKLKNVIILTPKALVRLSNTHTQTRAEKITRKKHNRSLSYISGIKSRMSKDLRFNNRARSMAIGNIGNEFMDMQIMKLLCKFCFREVADCKFVPCGHGGVCMSCGEIILKSNRKCYKCRGKISDIFEIEIENQNNNILNS
ncbi:hypothetical protein SteCoe_37212 [Stentor coeruleus]|uniref:RING-type domain-containing protein n=1 Tax=Stentor coeruleus TaxID=5963 RepID=A0A1R2ANH5_9CILI|nr:hypothetical protein SteCoe_37212 [Stentor coeruleus]